MPIEITMPRLSDTMEVGTLLTWNVREGDEVSAGDTLADVETDKATMELQAYDDGVVAHIGASTGDSIEVGKLIMVLAEEGEDVAAVKAGAAKAGDAGTGTAAATAHAHEETAHAPLSDGAVDSPPSDPSTRVFASPLARKVAEETGVDLGGIRGTGPSGRIVKKDVEAAVTGGGSVPQPATQPATQPQARPAVMAGAGLEARTEPLSNMRRTIAKRLVESKATIPHYQVTLSVDMEPLNALRKQLNEQLATQGVKLSVNDFLVRACALAMGGHPYVNSVWKGDSIELLSGVNVGVAIALPAERGGGLVVATLRGADAMGLRGISAQTKSLAKKAREKGLSIEEMSDATFTISNLGMFGVDHFNAIVNPPNAAILAVGAAIEQPVVKNGQVVPGVRMAMTMSSDHRVVDGAMAAAYLGTVRELLEQPATLLV